MFDCIKAFEERLEQVPGRSSFRIPGTKYPWSVSKQEGRALYEVAAGVRSVCASGATEARAIEIATAFGYSAAWLSLGLGATGALLTIDPYVEEFTQDDRANLTEHPEGFEPRGLELAKTGARLIGNDNVAFCRGFSPQDVEGAWRMAFEDKPLDLAFIDGHHLNGQPVKDWDAIAPLLHNQSVVLFHDSHVQDVKEAYWKAEEFFGEGHVPAGVSGFGLIGVCKHPKFLDQCFGAARQRRENPYAA